MLRNLLKIFMGPLSLILVVALPLLLPHVTQARESSQEIPAKVVKVEGATKTIYVRDMNGRNVAVTVPSESLATLWAEHKAQSSTSAVTGQKEDTLPVKVVSVDPMTKRLQVSTAQEKIIELEVPSTYLTKLQEGDPLELTW